MKLNYFVLCLNSLAAVLSLRFAITALSAYGLATTLIGIVFLLAFICYTAVSVKYFRRVRNGHCRD